MDIVIFTFDDVDGLIAFYKTHGTFNKDHFNAEALKTLYKENFVVYLSIAIAILCKK